MINKQYYKGYIIVQTKIATKKEHKNIKVLPSMFTFGISFKTSILEINFDCIIFPVNLLIHINRIDNVVKFPCYYVNVSWYTFNVIVVIYV